MVPQVDTGYNAWAAITKSDTVNFVGPNTFGQTTNPTTGAVANQGAALCDAIYIGGAGNIVVVRNDGTTETIAVIAGQVLQFKAIRVNSTSTTSTGMFALYK